MSYLNSNILLIIQVPLPENTESSVLQLHQQIYQQPETVPSVPVTHTPLVLPLEHPPTVQADPHIVQPNLQVSISFEASNIQTVPITTGGYQQISSICSIPDGNTTQQFDTSGATTQHFVTIAPSTEYLVDSKEFFKDYLGPDPSKEYLSLAPSSIPGSKGYLGGELGAGQDLCKEYLSGSELAVATLGNKNINTYILYVVLDIIVRLMDSIQDRLFV